jgi:DNA (cytosine-5)-methyltransferase 1
VRVLDLFSGIGGFSLGLERAGMRTVAFCEIDPYCRAVLRKHWPDVPCFSDVRDLHAYDVGPVDVICGGFPCQDISVAGKGAGLDGARSGLWSEYRRLIEECRPSWVVIENVVALRARGLDQVLGEISALGYDAEWHCIPAAAIGAPHRRDRIWIVAYPGCQRCERREGSAQWDQPDGTPAGRQEGHSRPLDGREGGCPRAVADADSARLAQRLRQEIERRAVRQEGDASPEGCWWNVEPDVGRVANGIPARVDRIRALGNAVVPQIVQAIGEAIMSADSRCGDVERSG